jgi:hypothetical protein
MPTKPHPAVPRGDQASAFRQNHNLLAGREPRPAQDWLRKAYFLDSPAKVTQQANDLE